MMAFFAVVRDSFREATDRKISTFLLIVSVLFALTFALIGLDEVPVEEVVESALREAAAAGRGIRVVRVDARAVDILVPDGTDGDDGHDGRHGPARPSGERVSHAADFARHILERRGVRAVSVRAPGAPYPPDAPRLRLALDYDPLDVLGGQRASIAFGAKHIDLAADFGGRLEGFTGREALLTLESLVPQVMAGWAGLIVAVIATAGFVPSMLTGGTAHLFLAKPVRRSTLLLGKYTGGILFVAFHAGVLTVLSAAAIWVRTGWFDPRFLLVPVAVAATFAILYAVSVLAAIVFETPVVSVLCALAFWMMCWGAWTARTTPRRLEVATGQKVEIPENVERGINAIYYVLPKTSDIYQALDRYLTHDRVSEQKARVAAQMRGDVDTVMVAWTSAAFTAGVVLLACWVFSRRDY